MLRLPEAACEMLISSEIRAGVKTPYEGIMQELCGILLEGLFGLIQGVLTIAQMALGARRSSPHTKLPGPSLHG